MLIVKHEIQIEEVVVVRDIREEDVGEEGVVDIRIEGADMRGSSDVDCVINRIICAFRSVRNHQHLGVGNVHVVVRDGE